MTKDTKPDFKVGDRIMMVRGRPGKGVVATLLCRVGWVETVWDDGGVPIVARVEELIKI